MESEVWLMKRKVTEFKISEKSLKETIKVQKDKSRQLLAACVYKIKEAENHTIQVRKQKDVELANLARELMIIQSNMLRERQRLESLIAEKQKVIDAQALEGERLRKQNKKLQQQILQSKLMAVHRSGEDQDMDTPSSEGSSPKSSFSTKSTKTIEMKHQVTNGFASPASVGNPSMTKTSPLSVQTKPPVPSRAGVNKKLQQGTSSARLAKAIQREDSGRESSDDQILRTLAAGTVTTSNSSGDNKDEGFSSETNGSEDFHVFRKQGIKLFNPKGLKTCSSLSVLEEHQVTPSSGEDPVTTITYWTEPYL